MRSWISAVASEQLCLFCGGDCAREDGLICGDGMAENADPIDRKVISIFDREPIRSNLNDADLTQDVTEAAAKLEDLAAEAASGQIRAFAIVWEGADNSINSLCSDAVSHNPTHFLGGLTRLIHRINTEQDWLQEQEDED